MGEGAALSMETSDVTLLDSNLEKIEYSIRMGKKVTTKIIQNVVFSLTVKFIVLGFALAGSKWTVLHLFRGTLRRPSNSCSFFLYSFVPVTNLWSAIASDVGAMLLVTLNAMMLLPKRQPHADIVANMKGDIEDGKSPIPLVGLARAGPCTDCDSGSVVDETERKESNAPTSSCSKTGCCSSERPGPKTCSDAGAEQKPHVDGCCKCSAKEKPSIADVADGDNDSCPKGCCDKPTLVQVNETPACSKGCCGSSKTVDNHHPAGNHSYSHSHDHHH